MFLNSDKCMEICEITLDQSEEQTKEIHKSLTEKTVLLSIDHSEKLMEKTLFRSSNEGTRRAFNPLMCILCVAADLMLTQ